MAVPFLNGLTECHLTATTAQWTEWTDCLCSAIHSALQCALCSVYCVPFYKQQPLFCTVHCNMICIVHCILQQETLFYNITLHLNVFLHSNKLNCTTHWQCRSSSAQWTKSARQVFVAGDNVSSQLGKKYPWLPFKASHN